MRDRLPHCKRLPGFGNIMDPQDVSSLQHSKKTRRQRAGNTLLGRFILAQPPDKAFPRDADDDGSPQPGERIKMSQNIKVMLKGFSEPDAGINRDPVPRDPRRLACRDPLAKPSAHVRNDIIVPRRQLHGPGVSLHVHQNDARLAARQHTHGAGISSESADIVDDRRSRLSCGPHDHGAPGIDRDSDAAARKLLDDRNDPPQLLLDRDRLRAGPRRLATHVNDIRARCMQRQSSRNRRGRRISITAIREAIGGDVDNRHDAGTIQREASKAERRGWKAGSSARFTSGGLRPVNLSFFNLPHRR